MQVESVMILDEIRDWADGGELHNIPRCCGLRFGFDASRPKLFSALGFPKVTAKLGYISVRHLWARYDDQGYIPCEYHLLRWAVTGKKPRIKVSVL